MLYLLSLLFYPFCFLLTIRSHHSWIRNLIKGIAFPILVYIWSYIWLILFISLQRSIFIIGKDVGFFETPIQISGTGSMYPTFPKGSSQNLSEQVKEVVAEPKMRVFPGGFTLFGRDFYHYALQRSDIISFSNIVTESIQKNEGINDEAPRGFVKRIVALPGDTVEIRDGFLYVNNKLSQEPFIAEARSTFGGKFLPDCTIKTVPEGQVFVLGDNRKASNDSRHDVGFVPIKDISYVLPYSQQQQFSQLWRDPSQDKDLSQTVTLDEKIYISLLNDMREKNNLKPLKYTQKLEESAKIRAASMLKYDDLSFEATKSGITMEKAMKQVGYSNIVWGESPTYGYYSAHELIDNYAQFNSWQSFLLDARFEETGVAALVGEINGCPVQIIVQHIAGYVPPTYSNEELTSWSNAIDQLRKLYENWSSVRTFGEQYEKNKDSYESIIAVITERLSIAQRISEKMQNNQWLNDEDKALLEKEKQLQNEQNNLATFLNDQAKSANE